VLTEIIETETQSVMNQTREAGNVGLVSTPIPTEGSKP
jgi:hypothetical protein